ncbi:MAG: SurA N-terminal domain-containing protein [Paracoccaceae bacterium]
MARASSSLSKTFVWILLALLIVGLAGFGATSLGGRISSIGTVGDKDIPVTQYVRALRSEMNSASAQFGTQITFEQAQMFGLQQQALSRLLLEKTLENETSDLGLSVGDETVYQELLGISAFRGLDGSFDKDAYKFALENAGLSEREFESQVRDEAARAVLQRAILQGIKMSETFTDIALAYVSEERNVTVVELGEADLATPIGEADQATLESFYSERTEEFALPESKAITLVKLTPGMVVATIEVQEDALRAAYEKDFDTYNLPERRLVERLSFLTQADAQAAAQRLSSKEISFEALVSERNLSLADIDLGDVNEKELGKAGSEVFALSEGEVSNLIETDAGFALYRVNGVLEAQTTPFEEIKDVLKADLSQDQARRAISAEISRIDDLLAAGATLEEIADETDMTLDTTLYYDGIETEYAGYIAFQNRAQALSMEDFPEIIELSDGGIMAMRLDEILPAREQALTEVIDAVRDVWREEALNTALKAEAERLRTLANEGQTLDSLAQNVTEIEALTRDGRIPNTPPLAVLEAFSQDVNEIAIVEGIERVFLVQTNNVNAGTQDEAEAEALKAQLSARLDQSLASDIFQIHVQALQETAGVELNEQALNAVHANFQ